MNVWQGKHVHIDEERALEVVTYLSSSFWEGAGIFKPGRCVLPEDRIELPKDEVRRGFWLFVMAHFMRGGIISDDAINMIGIIAQRRKFAKLLDCERLAKLKPKQVVDII